MGNRVDMLYLLDVKNFKIIKKHQYPFEVNEFAWNKNGNLIYLTTAKGNVDVLRFPEMEKSISFSGHNGNVYCIAFCPSGSYFALGAADGIVSVWDDEEMICISTLSKQDFPVRSISWSFDGQFIAAGSEDATIQVYNRLGDVVASLSTGCPVNSVCWNPRSNFLAWAGEETKALKGAVQLFGISK